MSIIPNYVPSGFHLINVVLLVKDAQKAIHWYNRAFGADEVMQLSDPNGNIVHAEMKIADTTFIIAPDSSIDTFKSNVLLQIYTPDAAAFMEIAAKEGAEILQRPKVEFNGEKRGRIKDPFNHEWIVATHVENLTSREVQNRFNALYPPPIS